MLHRVFVYGTLKKKQPNNCVLHEVKTGTRNYLGDGVSEDRYPLVISSRYNIPFMLNAPNSEGAKNIRGEVYEVDDAVLKALDELEVHPDFYRRETINIRLLSEREANTLQCLCYLLNDYRPEMLQLPFLESYDAFGEHGLRYIPSNNRDCKQPRGHFWYEVKTSCQKPGENERIFVYGTLKIGQPNHGMMDLEDTGTYRYTGKGVTQESYPLVIAEHNLPCLLGLQGKGKNVQGEIFEVDHEKLAFEV